MTAWMHHWHVVCGGMSAGLVALPPASGHGKAVR